MRFMFNPQDLLGIVRRRFFWALIPFLAICIVGLLFINSLPAIFESRATLIVEDQQIRNDFVQSAVSSDALQRVEAVRARVRARDNLLLLAQDLNLYTESGLSGSERVERMQTNLNITVSRISSSRRASDPSAITVRIAYLDPDPALAQRVTNRVMTDFVTRNVELRTDIADDTTVFLRDEEAKTRRDLDRVINEISRIKQENPKALPENRDLYERGLERATSEQTRIDNAMEMLSQEIRLFQMQKPLMLNSDDGPSAAEQELRAKRRLLEQLQREYQDTYPDVIAVKEELLSLERDLDPGAFKTRAAEEIENLNRQIASARRGSAEYAELVTRRDDLQDDLDAVPETASSTSLSEIAYNSQMATLEARMTSLQKQRQETEVQIAEYEERLAATPVVEGQLYRLTQEKAQLENDLSRLRANRSAAERSESMEQQSKGERLSVLEQPLRPDKPVSPNRPQMAVLLFGAAGAIAGVIGLFPEVVLPRVRTAKHMGELMPEMKIIEIPKFKTAGFKMTNLAVLAGLSGVSLALTLALAWTAFQTLL